MKQLQWQRRTEVPLIVAAVVYLVAYSVQVTLQPGPALGRALEGIIWGVWALFLVDYLVSLLSAPERGRWFVRHLHELVILLLPMLRPLRLLRLLPLLRILNRSGGNALRGHIVLYVIGAMTVLGYAGALAVLDVEQDAPGATILTLPDALWWALTTVTSVGYGDYYPVTGAGRLVAAGLMIGGIGVLSAVTAAFASWLVENVATARAAEAKTAESDARMQDQLKSVSLQIDTLTRQLAHGSHPGRPGQE
ncbi:potassium channel family protein [Arthrobacter burdickii]|uniref:Potassium channel family protein n=1 Tax=Arthrobacter burdickii TaxID=3035920 RepID=A0ABT8K4Q2_9MICC|nr:potassium channel family protein [Arthrobacter burdickii]MDN4612445.1 potassium channel family protein [Arthrobacter burdickii]